MNIVDILIPSRNKPAAGISKTPAVKAIVKEPPTAKPKKVDYGRVSRPGGSSEWNDPEYDFKLIAACLATESIFRRVVDKYVELIWRNGYKINSDNPQSGAYIQNRLVQISLSTNIPFDMFLRDVTQQLVTYNNAFIEKCRSSKKDLIINGRSIRPIIGYYAVDATSVKVAKNEHGKIIKYRQNIGSHSNSPEWSVDDMIHIVKCREAGLTFGTPMVAPVIDDIRALRRLEENVEMLIYNYAIPLFHYKVGDEDHPANDIELELAEMTVKNMPADGMLITPNYHSVSAIGAESRALRMNEYLTYFRDRVFSGLGTSSVAMGITGGANRSTSEVLERSMYATVKEYQNVIKTYFEDFIFNELLMEGGFELNDANKVFMFFPEIDLDTKIKMENHMQNMYHGNIMSLNECREVIGKDRMTPDEYRDTYLFNVDLPRSIVYAVDEPFLCYSSDTEVLTIDGWKYFNELTDDDKVATLIDNILTYEVPMEYFEYDYDGQMYLLHDKDINLCVTPNHKLYVDVGNGYELIEAREVKGVSKKFKRTSEWNGGMIRWDRILPDTTIDTDELIRSLGQYISNGNLPDDNDFIRSIMHDDIRIPRLIYELSTEDIRSFLIDMNVFNTSSKGLADDIQELCLKAGWAASIDYKGSNYIITIGDDVELPDPDVERYINYNGKVYCVETSSGLLYVRREGRSLWCGNSTYGNKIFKRIKPQEPGGVAAAKAADMPSNQFGAKLAPGTTKDMTLILPPGSRYTTIIEGEEALGKGIINSSLNFTGYYDSLKVYYNALRDDFVNGIDHSMKDDYIKGDYIKDDYIKDDYIEGMLKVSRLYVIDAITSGAMDALQSRDVDSILTSDLLDYAMLKSREWLVDAIDTTIDSALGDMGRVGSIFDTNSFRLKLGAHNEQQRMYNIGFIAAGRSIGHEEFELVSNGLCKLHDGEVYIINSSMSYDDVPPGYMTHPLCTCKIRSIG